MIFDTHAHYHDEQFDEDRENLWIPWNQEELVIF